VSYKHKALANKALNEALNEALQLRELQTQLLFNSAYPFVFANGGNTSEKHRNEKRLCPAHAAQPHARLCRACFSEEQTFCSFVAVRKKKEKK
jgi:hypothetical protein